MNGLVVTPTFTNPSGGDYKMVVAASGQVPTSFTKLIGKTNLTVDVTSEVVWGMRKLELALALDNTGSMSSNNKMTELKKAAKTLLQTLQGRRQERRRHQGRDHPVRTGSQRRNQQCERNLAAMGCVGCG